MSIIISYITISLLKCVLSSAPNKLCVSSPTRDITDGLQGEYSYGFDDPNEIEYWTKPVGTHCYHLDHQQNPLYIVEQTITSTTSTTSNTWHYLISSGLAGDSLWYYECKDCEWLPEQWNNNNNWYDQSNNIIQDLTVIPGECPPSQKETHLTVTDYPNEGKEGCNGEFVAVDGRKNLYKRTEDYDYHWEDENGHPQSKPLPHFWFYNYNAQGFLCTYSDVEDTENSWYDYANVCWGPPVEGTKMKFYN